MRLLGIAAMVLLFGANALGGNYDGKVEDRMTYMQVVQFLGEEGEKIEDIMDFGSLIETYRWGKTVRVFRGGRLSSYSEGTSVPESKIKKSPLDKFENPDLHPIDDSRDLNAGKFEAVKIDMKPKEVFGILGKTNIRVKKYTDDAAVDKYKRVTFYQWFNEYSRGSMNVIFLDDQVIGKGQVWLTDPATVGSVELTVGMNSEKVISLLGANSTCRKYMEVTPGEGHKVMNLCRWRTNIGVKMNVIFLDDMLVGTWKY